MSDNLKMHLINNAEKSDILSIYKLCEIGFEYKDYFNKGEIFLNNPKDNKFYLKSINVVNYKKISEISIDFESGVNILIGENGVGKTTILEGISRNLSWISNNILRESNSASVLNDFDINNFAKDKGVGEGLGYCEFACKFNYGKKSHIAGSLTRSIKGSNVNKKSNLKEYKNISSIWRNFNSINEINLPVFALYSVDRMKVKNNTSTDKDDFRRFDVYNNILNNSTDFNIFVKWLIQIIKIKNNNRYNKLLNQINELKSFIQGDNEAIIELLNEKEKEYNFLKNNSENNHQIDNVEIIENIFKIIYSDFKCIKLEMDSGKDELILQFNNNFININQLSDGERLYLGLLSDIAMRLILLNPKLRNPLEGHGIILIDEIELHLHPRWQQQVVLNLQKIFPNIQFILTTHSPHVLSTVDKSAIRILNENNEVKPADLQTKGVISSDILERIMNTFAVPQVSEAIMQQNLINLIDQDLFESDKAKEYIVLLEQHFGVDHPEMINIYSKIELMKLKNKFKHGLNK